MHTEITKDRISNNSDLISVLNLGNQSLTGVFPKTTTEQITSGPLELVWSQESGLVQLKHSYSLSEMYGENYGYRSGLNQSMVDHLSSKAKKLEKLAKVSTNDVILDIGSNDGTLLKSYNSDCRKVGIDPTGVKFAKYYPVYIALVKDFFSSEVYFTATNTKARIVTTISMFYDLEDPVSFAKQVNEVLDDNGIWHLEQSYLPSMLRMNSYDTICHEHLEYYSLHSIKYIMDRSGFKIIDVSTNSVNGGSFTVTVCKENCTAYDVNSTMINWMMKQESRMELNTPKPYRELESRAYKHREDLTDLIRSIRADGKNILGYGASTKGNVMLQFCKFTDNDITAIAEVNTEKFGCFTPGTHIPIISETNAVEQKPDYYLVMPWHFRESILKREKEYLARGGKLIFPFPEIEVVG